MPSSLSDLRPEAEKVQLELLRQRHPNASPEELRRRLADILLGPELAVRVYGPPTWEE